SDCLRRGSSLRLCPEVREVLAQGQTVTLAEPATLRRLFGETELPPNCKTLVISPLMLDNTLAGALFAARGEGRGFLSSEAAFLRAVAEHLALAWRHAKLFESLEMAYHDLRQTQAALMQQERLRALGQMASGIAHDINNALSPVSLFASIMLRDPELPERHRHAVEVILKAVDSAGQTLRRLKDFYRKTPEDAHVEPVNLAALVEEVVELTKPQWSAFPQQHGVLIQMETHIPKDLPPLLAVASELRDALTNLILNAVDALPTGGTISIRASLIGPPGAEDHVLLEVSDNGIGMDEETRARALEPFFTTKPTGTGMGLPTVFGAVQRLGGHVELDSAPGRGTTVRLLLPLRRLPPFQAPPAEAVTLPPLRILFVDDEPLIREALGHALEQEGHHITCCQSAEEGLEAFTQALGRDEAFDVVITDLGMPGMSGRELAAKIKGLSPTTPVVLLSGWGTTLGERGPNQVDAVLSKPASITAVCSTLARLYHAKGQQEP
ncbi:MAG: ATP-binding protein, partial [Thermoanaerobaculum sp.]|nr:ATP-binding protein [Thermoanaerobaculum sp.]